MSQESFGTHLLILQEARITKWYIYIYIYIYIYNLLENTILLSIA